MTVYAPPSTVDSDEEYQTPRHPHPVCQFLRQVRQASRMSLGQLEAQYGESHGLSAVVIGSYERGDRQPPLHRLEAALNVFGYRLEAVPIDTAPMRLPTSEAAETLRDVAAFIEEMLSAVLPAVPDTAAPTD